MSTGRKLAMPVVESSSLLADEKQTAEVKLATAFAHYRKARAGASTSGRLLPKIET